jgi:RimJ/RimL family protein N-acetyltransferase
MVGDNMLTINLRCENMFFRDVKKEDLQDILKLYNQNEINMYATGLDRPMSFEDINQKYLEVLVNSHEFFAGIFINNSEYDRMIGVVKGRIDYDNNEVAWISSILIDSSFQNSGIGTKAVSSLIRMLQDTYDIKFIKIGILAGNIIGHAFWKKIGFNYIRTIQQYFKMNSKTEDFIIMKKDLR